MNFEIMVSNIVIHCTSCIFELRGKSPGHFYDIKKIKTGDPNRFYPKNCKVLMSWDKACWSLKLSCRVAYNT